MIWGYRILFLPVLLVLAPRYLLRMRRRGGYGENFLHRFGCFRPLPKKSSADFRIWVQAVSVGEMIAIGPLLQEFQRSGAQVFLTTTTSTGYRLAQERYRDVVLGIGYFPLDWWRFSTRAWDGIGPDLALLVEGERWPEHLHQGAMRGVPVVSINARISERSFSRWRWFPAMARWNLGNLSRILCAAEIDRGRFLALGAKPEAVTVTGNLKLDVALPELDEAARAVLRAELGFAPGPIIVGASTWPGEEAALLAAFARTRALQLNAKLLLVPRHAERRTEIVGLLEKSPYRWALRSAGPVAGELDVLVADTTGELRRLLQVADVVYVGKSLPPHTDGQTPVEAAALGRAIIAGPGMKNFQEIAGALRQEGALVTVDNPAELTETVAQILFDDGRRQALAEAARRWQENNAGSLQRTLEILRRDFFPPGRAGSGQTVGPVTKS